MELPLKARPGCLGAVLTRFCSLGERRRTGRRLRDLAHGVRFDRASLAGGVRRVTARFALSAKNELVWRRALAEAAAEVAVKLGGNVVEVGVEAGAEPRIVVRAARRDLVGDAFERALAANPEHLTPKLWIALGDGRFAAELVDPNAPFEADEPELTRWLATGLAKAVALVVVRREPASFLVRIELYGSLRALRAAFSSARGFLVALPR